MSVTSTWGSAGLTGIWAEQNTRESLFAALRGKETFATTGPRIRVRLFAGHGLEGVNLATEAGVRTAIRGKLRSDWIEARRRQQREQFLARLRQCYSVAVEWPEM